MSRNTNFENNETDLGELVVALWSHKILITLFTGLFTFLAGYHALTVTKTFTAQAIFQIKQENNSSSAILSGELGALASLAGITGNAAPSSSISLLERVIKREFIVKMKDKASLDLDPHFNTYNPNYRDPFWKATIKQLIGWQKTKQEKSAIIENNVINNYRQNVKFESSESGSISISITHVDPKKASDYANTFMEEIRRLVETESLAAQRFRLNYLSETLADALQEMEKTQENLKDYALKNSALAQENFIADSLKLDQIRMERRKVGEISSLLYVLESFIKSGNLDSSSYEALRSRQPLVDDIEFRRILGMSETISAWTWPEIETVEAVSTTLRDRVKRLDVEINNIEENAIIYAASAEDLAKFTRDAKIAEATYTVLIEQVKSQTLAAGFQPETFKVFQYATPPLAPSSPNRNTTLMLGAVFGIFLGCAVAVINSIRRGVYYTRSALLSDASAELTLKSKSIRRLSKKSISSIFSSLSKHRIVGLDEATLKLANKKVIYVFNSGGQPTASNAARLLASHSAQSGKNVVICDTTGQSEKEIKEKPILENSDLPIVGMEKNISVITGVNVGSFFTSSNFKSTIKDLIDGYDQVFVCSNNNNNQLGLMALEDFVPGLVMISGLRKTRKSDIKKIKTKQTLDLLFYD